MHSASNERRIELIRRQFDGPPLASEEVRERERLQAETDERLAAHDEDLLAQLAKFDEQARKVLGEIE